LQCLISKANSEDELLSQIDKYRKDGNVIELTESLNKLGYYYWERGQFDEAIKHFESSLVENTKLGNKNAIMNLYTNIGLLFTEQRQFETALLNFRKSLGLREGFKETQSISSELLNIATALQSLGRYFESIENCEKALEYAKVTNNLKLIKRSYGILAENYEKVGNAKKSLEFFELYSTIQKHIQKQQLAKSIEETQQQMHALKQQSEEQVKKAESEKIEKEKELEKAETSLQKTTKTLAKSQELTRHQDKVIKKSQAEIEHKKFMNKVIGIGFAIVLVFAIFVFWSYTQKKKTNKLLSYQNNEILKQQEIIKKKNADITKSITYAQRIQKAMLPTKLELNKYLNEAFILFKPRDIVSGDFYWFTPIKEDSSISPQDTDFLISAIDCTGHGVPGAFMSMIGFNLLDEIVAQNITMPDQILNQLHNGIKRSLKQNETDNRDGMDLAICKISRRENKIYFSGAKNPLLCIKDKEIFEYKGDKYPVGGNLEKGRMPFSLTEIPIEKNASYYLYSDGYQDQFGGENGMKFMSKKFKRLLASIGDKPILEQKEILNRTLEEWKGSKYKQIDDILVIGFKLP